MDNITHTLVGLTLARAGLGRTAPGATAVLLTAINAPDLDIVVAVTGGAVPYLAAHRGWTHGPIGVASLALAAAVIVWSIVRWRRGPGRPPSLPALAGVALIGGLLHVLMDVPTSYGTRMLAPFVERWYALDWLPIIDVYVWLILFGGLLAARVKPSHRAAIAGMALLAVAGVYVLRATAHGRALELAAREDAAGVESRCASAPVFTRHPSDGGRAAPPGGCLRATAIPTFFSPFRWLLIREYADGYELRDASLVDRSPTARLWIPTERGAAVDAARQAETARVFLDFSRLPAVTVTTNPGGERRVRFVDVRFVRGPFGLDRNSQARAPFVATVILGRDGAVAQQRLGD